MSKDGLKPIGEIVKDALSGMGGPVAAIRDATPQALHHFTQADQVNQLVEASEAHSDRGFMARLLALCSLPRTNPGNRKEYKRVNGPYTLYMNAVGGNKLPFGNLPRLLLAWVCSEAVRTQSRELVLGKSLSKFMRTLGINSTSGGRSRGTNPAPQSNEAPLWLHGFNALPGRARRSRRKFSDGPAHRVLVERAQAR